MSTPTAVQAAAARVAAEQKKLDAVDNDDVAYTKADVRLANAKVDEANAKVDEANAKVDEAKDEVPVNTEKVRRAEVAAAKTEGAAAKAEVAAAEAKVAAAEAKVAAAAAKWESEGKLNKGVYQDEFVAAQKARDAAQNEYEKKRQGSGARLLSDSNFPMSLWALLACARFFCCRT
jgi:hypothetical protein